MKKIFISTIATLLAFGVSADIKDEVRIYINPGHGAWCGECRHMGTVTHGDADYTDTCGFYESNTNMQKGFGMLDKLIEYGIKYDKTKGARDLSQNLVISRVKSGDVHNGLYDRPLSEIAAEAELNNFDMFISIHSNATTEGSTTNYPLFLYRGYDSSEGNAGSSAMAKACWPHWQQNPHMMWTHYTSSTNIRGDVSYWDQSYTTTHTNGKSYSGYYGVLRQGVPGFLVEGYFHTYQPARHKAMNWDACRWEGAAYAKGVNDYFGIGYTENYGTIYGVLRDAEQTFTHTYYTPNTATLDKYLPINNATVTLKNSAGEVVDTYTTDDEYNGVFVFNNVAPGTYTAVYSHPDYKDLSQTITVKANETTFPTPQISTSTEIVAVRGHYAYDLAMTNSGNDYTLTFKSTGAVDKGSVILTNTATGATQSIDLGAVKAGENTVTVNAVDLGSADKFSWAVSLDNPRSTAANLIYNDADVAFSNGTYYANGGVTIDKDFSSSYFGRIYVSAGYGQGLQIYNPDLTKNGGKFLGSKFNNTNSSSPFRIKANSGKVYITDWSDAHGGLWVYDPAAGNAVTNMFVGTNDGTGLIANGSITTGGGTTGVDFVGTGANRKMYVFCEDYPTGNAGNQLLRYDLGTADSWSKAPSAAYSQVSASTLMANTNVEVLVSEKGVFASQTRYSGSNTSGVPAFVHMATDGTVNFNSGNSLTSLNGCNSGAIAVYNNDTFAAVNGDGNIDIFSLSWSGSTPSFAKLYTITLSNTTIVTQMDFDIAGNLYLFSKQEGLMVYTLKNPARQTVTEANSSLLIQGVVITPVTDLKATRQCYGEGENTTPGSIDVLVTWTGQTGDRDNLNNYKIYYQTMRRDSLNNRVYDNNGTWELAGTASIDFASTSTGSFIHKAVAYGSDANGYYDRIYNYKVVPYYTSTGEECAEAVIEGKGNSVTSFAPSVPVDVTLSQPTTDVDGSTHYSFDLQLDLALNDNFAASRIDDADAMPSAMNYVIVVDEATAKALNNASNASEVGLFAEGPATITANNCTHHEIAGWYMTVDFTDIKPTDDLSAAAKSLVWKNVNPSLTYAPQVYLVSTRAFNFNGSDAEASKFTMVAPSPGWNVENVGIVPLNGDFSALAGNEDYPVGTFAKVGDTENATYPVTIANANTIGTTGATLSPLAVDDDVIANWDISYTFTLKDSEGNVVAASQQESKNTATDNQLYSNVNNVALDLLGLQVGCTETTAPDGRTRLVYNADNNKAYTLVVRTTYSRTIDGVAEEVSSETESEVVINPTFAAPAIDPYSSPGYLFLEKTPHHDASCTDSDGNYDYYYDAGVDIAWESFGDNLARYMGYHATPLIVCEGHSQSESGDTIAYLSASVLTDAQVALYNERISQQDINATRLSSLGFDGTNDWSALASANRHLPILVHYVWAGNEQLAAENVSEAQFEWELSANYPLIVTPSPILMINAYPSTGVYSIDPTNSDMQVITTVNDSYKSLIMDGIIVAQQTGVENINLNNNAPATYYNLQGVQIENPTNGIYIKLQGNKATKVHIK